MIKKNLDKIYQKTAKDLNLEEEVVKHVVQEGVFRDIKRWTANPTKAKYELEEFGKLEIYLKTVVRAIERDVKPLIEGGHYVERNKKKLAMLSKFKETAEKFIQNGKSKQTRPKKTSRAGDTIKKSSPTS